MNVEYTGRQTTVTPKLKAQAEAGIARIAKIVEDSATAHVILAEDKYRHIAEVTIHTRHGDFVASCEAASMEQALHDALQRVEKQVIKGKDRFDTVTRQPKPMVAAL